MVRESLPEAAMARTTQQMFRLRGTARHDNNTKILAVLALDPSRHTGTATAMRPSDRTPHGCRIDQRRTGLTELLLG